MALKDVLPDRPLTFDEFQDLQRQDTFDSVMTSDKLGDKDILFLKKDGTEYILHWTEDSGWHRCEDGK